MATATAPKKTLYHGEFRELSAAGPVRVSVKTGPMPSTKKKGEFYVELEIDGHQRYLHPENDACLQFWEGRKGTEVFVMAEGTRDEARYIEVGQPGSATPAPQPRPAQARPKGAMTQAEQAARPAAPQRPPVKPDGKHAPVFGATVGACMNKAVDIVTANGDGTGGALDPMSPAFYQAVYFVASDLVRLSLLLEEGKLAPSAKERTKAATTKPAN